MDPTSAERAVGHQQRLTPPNNPGILPLEYWCGCRKLDHLARGLLTGSRERGGGQTTVRSGSGPIPDAMYADDDFDAVAAVRIRLSEDEVATPQAPYRPHTVLGHH